MIKFNVKLSDDTYRDMGELAGLMDGTMADVIREALSVFWWVASEYQQGNQLMVRRGDQITELMVPSLERVRAAALRAKDRSQPSEPGSSPAASSSEARSRTSRRPPATRD